MAILRRFTWLLIVLLVLVSGCTRTIRIEQTSLRPKDLAELEGYLLSHDAGLEVFRFRGPFTASVQENRILQLSSTERIDADLYLSAAPASKAALVILLHGFDSSKRAHAEQAMHLASWGMHALTVQLPNQGPWVTNGRTLAKIAGLIARSPELIDSRIDAGKLVLAGHSFGGASVAVALAEGAPVLGGILLDPAAAVKTLPTFLKRINKPLIILGADDEFISARNRDWFYRYTPRQVAELSIRDAAHEDAQYPSEVALHNGGEDPETTPDIQLTFAATLTAAASSLTTTGSFDHAWTSFGPAFQKGLFFNPKRK